MVISTEPPGEKPAPFDDSLDKPPQIEVMIEKDAATVELVSWDGDDDPENPRNWSARKKWGNVGLVSMITIITPLASSALAPAVPDMMAEFHDESSAMASLVVSAYVVGFALGPLFFAPLSETYGRLVIYHVSSLLFLAFTVGCALSTGSGIFVAFRLLAGCAGATPMVLGGGTISDIIPTERRGAAMTLWGCGQLFGPVVGPIAGGFLNEAAGWRWVSWLLLIIGGVTTILGFIFMRETYAPVLLARKARRLRQSTRDDRYQSQYDINRQSVTRVLRSALVRPIRMLFTSPILFVLCVDVSVVYGYLYLVFTTSTSVYQDLYGFSSGTAGLSFLGIGIGMLVGLLSVGFASDNIATRVQRKRGLEPEDRLPPLIPGAFLIPIGLFWYGWALKNSVFWLVSLFGMAFFGAGIIATFVPIQMYIIDAFGEHGASALAGLATMRSIVGATLPLAGRQISDPVSSDEASVVRTVARYQHDATLRQLLTTVVSYQQLETLGEAERRLFKSVTDVSDHVLVTKETIFHPQGGGQPSDRGTITAEDDPQLRFNVKLVRKLTNGLILHAGCRIPPELDVSSGSDGAEPTFRESQAVMLRIDDETRNYHSRLHTAGHLVGLAVRQLVGTIGAVSELKANHAPGSAFVEFQGLISGEHKAVIQEVVDRSDLPVRVCWWDEQQVREKCTAVPDAVVFPEGEDVMRVVEIDGLGAYPCGGTHVPTTRDIGKAIICRISRQKGISKVSYEVASENAS
ncbi:hypothetical protein DL767_003872 [Monosporascus sp. MG133]|nr:hypothetical protein DL767_003872 [Monosporascus sp. MG133]